MDIRNDILLFSGLLLYDGVQSENGYPFQDFKSSVGLKEYRNRVRALIKKRSHKS